MKIEISFTRFKISRKGFRELRKSDKVDRDLEARARRVAAAAGPGWEARRAPGRNRSRWVVVPTTDEARRQSIMEMTGVRALDAGR